MSDLYKDLVLQSQFWRPKFSIKHDLVECATQINKPHEDYPARIPETTHLIREFDNIVLDGQLTESHILGFHSYLFKAYNPKHILRGEYRKISVSIKGVNRQLPEPYIVPEFMRQLLPTSFVFNAYDFEGNREQFERHVTNTLIDWYRIFQHIHPFQDGNGRVGGIVVAGISKRILNYYLTPGQ